MLHQRTINHRAPSGVFQLHQPITTRLADGKGYTLPRHTSQHTTPSCHHHMLQTQGRSPPPRGPHLLLHGRAGKGLQAQVLEVRAAAKQPLDHLRQCQHRCILMTAVAAARGVAVAEGRTRMWARNRKAASCAEQEQMQEMVEVRWHCPIMS